jgi:hypothetical protein
MGVRCSASELQTFETDHYKLTLDRACNVVGLDWKTPALQVIQEPRLGESFRIVLPEPGYESNIFKGSEQRAVRIERDPNGVTCYFDQLTNERQTVPVAVQYPLIVVPDWKDIGDSVADILTGYVRNGGKMVVFGNENASLFVARLNLRMLGPASERTYFVADDSGFAQVHGNWMEFDAAQTQVVAYGYSAPDTRKDRIPIAALVRNGKGSAVVCPVPITSLYASDTTPVFRSLMRGILEPLLKPMVRLDGDYPALEIVLRQKAGQTLIHLINTDGVPVANGFRHSGVVPNT